ncbi:MAG: elongation factor P [Phycisphaerae bacterium]|nr:elongation factor P [Phycisphaerae bacterium]
MVKASELRKGKVISYEGDLYTVHSVQHVAKGNWRSYIQTKIKSIKTGQLVDARFSVDDKVETPFVETKPFEYLYRDGDSFVAMDQNTYDQVSISAEMVGDAELYLKENEVMAVQFIDGKLVGIELPNVVELEVTDTTPVVKGATATNQSKDAALQTGLVVKVPPFIGIGDVLRIDTRSGEYLERAKG